MLPKQFFLQTCFLLPIICLFKRQEISVYCLCLISIISACLVLKEISVNSIIQGILLSSVTVFANQIWKQLLSGEKSNKTEEIINEDKKDN